MPAQRDGPDNAESAGASDLSPGVKFSIEVLIGIPGSAVATVTVLLDVNGFGSSEDATLALNLNYAYGFLPALSLVLSGNLGYADEATQASAGLALAGSFGSLSPYAQVFVERAAGVFGQDFELEEVNLAVGAGLAFMPSATTQFDVFVDVLPARSTKVDLAERPTALRSGVGRYSILL